ncbi:MAG: arginine--tRNA ligase, partial [Bacteroidales bacterium]|nr:arginine--tRNA ligase [Bacteroidales bacterium]
HNPSVIAAYVYDLAKEFNQFYHDFSILHEPQQAVRSFRLMLSLKTAWIIRSGMSLLGIEVPERM